MGRMFSPSGPDTTPPNLLPPVENPGALTLAAGAVTMVLAFALVLALEHEGRFVLDWTAKKFFPVGAMLVGALAASGFLLGAWWTGARVTAPRVAVAATMLAAGYCLYCYVSFRFIYAPNARLTDGSPIAFWTWFDGVTRSYVVQEQNFFDGRRTEEALGAGGYALRLGQLVGLSLAGAALFAALRKWPRCDKCQRYIRSGPGWRPRCACGLRSV